jgi:hypothetical protein
MRKILFTIAFLMAVAFTAFAQTKPVVRVGAFVGYTTAPDHESPNLFQHTNRFFPGVKASTEFWIGPRLALRVSGEASKTPQLPSLFTTDEGEYRPSAEVRVLPELELNLSRVFFRGGADIFYHFIPNPEHEAYSRSYGVNPTATAGLRAGNNEASVTYLFRDKGTDLYGYRANFYRDFGKFRFGVEANRLQYKERNREGYVDSYYETDNVFKFSVDIPITGRK